MSANVVCVCVLLGLQATTFFAASDWERERLNPMFCFSLWPGEDFLQSENACKSYRIGLKMTDFAQFLFVWGWFPISLYFPVSTSFVFVYLFWNWLIVGLSFSVNTAKIIKKLFTYKLRYIRSGSWDPISISLKKKYKTCAYWNKSSWIQCPDSVA